MNSQQFQQFNNFGKHLKGFSLSGLLLLGFGYLALNSYYYGNFVFILVDVGHYAIKFNKLTGGLTTNIYREGYNLKLPIIETPIIYNVQTR